MNFHRSLAEYQLGFSRHINRRDAIEVIKMMADNVNVTDNDTHVPNFVATLRKKLLLTGQVRSQLFVRYGVAVSIPSISLTIVVRHRLTFLSFVLLFRTARERAQ